MNSKVNVIIRCRPLIGEEVRHRKCVNINVGDNSVHVGDKRFQFEKLYEESADQEIIYQECISLLVDGCFEGYNATVLAYGQSGSGKTHSLYGNITNAEEEGVIPRVIRQIFHTIHCNPSNIFSVRVSMVEIYNEECKDLLHIEIPAKDILIREDKDGRIFFTGAREEAVQDIKSSLQFLERGNLNRRTAETMINQHSSRSHAIFSISLEIWNTTSITSDAENVDGNQNAATDAGSSLMPQQKPKLATYIQSKIHLVDLAGSERAKRTGAIGERFKESVGINQGLLSLGKVIRALSSQMKENGYSTDGIATTAHIPYRDSKLTRFLQDSLGGNSRTVMLVCISPSELSFHETLNTLQYANRAKSVRNKLKANVIEGQNVETELLESSIVGALRAQLQEMKEEMAVVLTQRGVTSNEKDATAQIENETQSISYKPKQLNQVKKLLKVVSEVTNALRQLRSSPSMVSESKDTLIIVEVSYRKLKQIIQQTVQVLFSNDTDPHSSFCNGTVLSTADSLVNSSLSFASMKQFLNESLSNTEDNTSTSRLQSTIQYQKEIIESLQEQLQGCNEDLKRDEEIFSEKMKELKGCRKRIKELEGQVRQFEEKGDSLSLAHSTGATTVEKLDRSTAEVNLNGTLLDQRVDRSSELTIELNAAKEKVSQLQSVIEKQDMIIDELKRNRLQDEFQASHEPVAQGNLDIQAAKIIEMISQYSVLRDHYHADVNEWNRMRDDFENQIERTHSLLALKPHKDSSSSQSIPLLDDEINCLHDEIRDKTARKIHDLVQLTSQANAIIQLEMKTNQLKVDRDYCEMQLNELQFDVDNEMQSLEIQINQLNKTIQNLQLKREDILVDHVDNAIAVHEMLDQCLEQKKQLESSKESLHYSEKSQRIQEMIDEIENLDIEIKSNSHAIDEMKESIQREVSQLLELSRNGTNIQQMMDRFIYPILGFFLSFEKTDNILLDILAMKPSPSLLNDWSNQIPSLHNQKEIDYLSWSHHCLFVWILLKLLTVTHYEHRESIAKNLELKDELHQQLLENEQLITSFQQLRNDSYRRLTESKKENESKISYLLQQIRSLEGKLVEYSSSSSQMIGSSMKSASFESIPTAIPISMKLSLQNNAHRKLPDEVLSTHLRSSWNQLNESNQMVLRKDEINLDSTLNEEVIRRWNVEKTRREQLEQSNVEMANELRIIKQNIKNYEQIVKSVETRTQEAVHR